MTQTRMAVVGVGALGRHHARILSELETVDLVAVADTNIENAQAIADACGTEAVADYHDLFGRIDAVSIAVPTFAHLAVAGEFLKQGIPLLVEKPLAGNVQDAEQLVELADANNTLMQVGHIERFNPATQVAWAACGAPKYIRAERLSPYAFRSTDIGAVHDLMIHDLDLVLDLADSPVVNVQAFGMCILGGHEDSVQARVTFENGCIADITASRVNPFPRRVMQVWSTSGTVTVDFTSREVVAYRPSEQVLYAKSPLERAAEPEADIDQLKADVFGKFLTIDQPVVAEGDALTAELSHFVECVQAGRQPLVDGAAALRAMRLADDILTSVAAHQWDGCPEGAIGPHARFDGRQKIAG
jgi:predicted dehydrogenase